jgi:hypothetical protein
MPASASARAILCWGSTTPGEMSAGRLRGVASSNLLLDVEAYRFTTNRPRVLTGTSIDLPALHFLKPLTAVGVTVVSGSATASRALVQGT